jgi:hypothetical protein
MLTPFPALASFDHYPTTLAYYSFNPKHVDTLQNPSLTPLSNNSMFSLSNSKHVDVDTLHNPYMLIPSSTTACLLSPQPPHVDTFYAPPPMLIPFKPQHVDRLFTNPIYILLSPYQHGGFHPPFQHADHFLFPAC